MKHTNPKDAISGNKVPMHMWPPVATAHGALALMVGAVKYEHLNWRRAGVRASVYKSAIQRHMDMWFEGEDVDESGCHPLAHVMACCAIILDAEACGKLVDDRNTGGGYLELLERLNKATPEIRERATLATVPDTPIHAPPVVRPFEATRVE